MLQAWLSIGYTILLAILGGTHMQKLEKIDLTKLLGFETVEPTDDVDFQDETFSAKLGAKVGGIIEAVEPEGR